MSLFLDSLPPPILRRGCKVGTFLESGHPETGNVAAVLNDPAVASWRIEKALRAIDVHISDTTLKRHRRKACACPTS